MKKIISLKIANRDKHAEAYKKLKERFSGTRPAVTPRIARQILPFNVQNHLNTLTYTMKAILDKALAAYPPYEYNDGTYRLFFVEPRVIGANMIAFTNLILVKYSTPSEAEIYKNALYWPGGGIIMAEYLRTEEESSISITTLEHPECWESPLSEDVIIYFTGQICKNLIAWRNTQKEKENDDAIAQFTSAIMYIEAGIPEIAASMDMWIDDEKEMRIEYENYEDYLTNGGKEDASIFEGEE